MPHMTETELDSQIQLIDFIKDHGSQLKRSGIPEKYWQTLQSKLAGEVYDAGQSFQIVCEETLTGDGDETDSKNLWKVVVALEDGISVEDPNHIYLIDHAWTYEVRHARLQLQQVPGLLDRMTAMMEVQTEGLAQEEVIEAVLQEMWRFNQTYSFGNFSLGTDEATPLWYILDEFGSRIQHSNEPTFKTVPFFHVPSNFTFTLLWPLQFVDKGGEVTRDFVGNVSNPLTRQARLLPWIPTDMTNVSYIQEEPDVSFFTTFKMEEQLPDLDVEFPPITKDRILRVFMNNSTLASHLTDSRFVVVETEEEADIIWTMDNWKNYRLLSDEYPHKFVNQFPSECVVTLKDLLAITCRRASKDPSSVTDPKWLPTTYDLLTELPKFVSYYQYREKEGLDNHWICKPWNLSRGLDTHITSNLNYLVRLPDSGPKIAQKYVEDPVLFHRDDIGDVKFDIRYIVMLRSVKPLKLYVYRVFWLRFSNKVFSMDHFDDYVKHFTVMNYVEDDLKQIHYDEFIPMFDQQYPAFNWNDTEEKIFDMFREIFKAATSKPPPMGISHSPQSRSFYAIDLMLKWQTDEKGDRYMQPVLCEVNFCPDCNRACQYHPNFINDMFAALFFDETDGRPNTLL